MSGFLVIYSREAKAAAAELDKYLAQKPSIGKAWGMRGMLHYRSRNYDKALECLSKAVEQKYETPDLYAALGMIYYAK